MIEMTDADRALIASIVDETSTESIYHAGLAAGIERSAKVCDKWAENALSKQDGKLYDVDTNLRMMAIGPQDCAAAIRALNAPAAP